MNTIILLSTLLLTSPFTLENESLHKIGLKVWQNECRATLDGLITWSSNEEFPSLGIGHFIWYPAGATKTFEESFPALIEHLLTKEIEVPSWISSKKGCPWKTREAFLKDKRSKKMNELRQLLASTIDEQIVFLLERFKVAEEKLLPNLTEKQKTHLQELKKSPQGVYALIDYVHFKGIGLSAKERYRKEGWGVLQVLQNIPDQTPKDQLVSAFITSAKRVLNRRVKNAPIKRNESQYLKGWNRRLESYSKPL